MATIRQHFNKSLERLYDGEKILGEVTRKDNMKSHEIRWLEKEAEQEQDKTKKAVMLFRMADFKEEKILLSKHREDWEHEVLALAGTVAHLYGRVGTCSCKY